MGIIFGLISAISYGLIPLFTLPLLAAHIPVETALAYRFGIATAALGLILYCKRESFAIGWTPFWKIGALSLIYAAAVMLYFYALQLLPSGVVATLQFLFPVMVMLIMVCFFHEPFRWHTLGAICLAVAGVACLSLGQQDSGPQVENWFSGPVFLGVAMSLLAGLCNGLYFVALQVARLPKINGLMLTFYVMFFGAICFLLQAMATDTLVFIRAPGELGMAVLLALITAVLSNWTLILSIRDIGSTFASILAVGEPLTAVATGLWVFDEPFTTHLAFGVILIVASVLLALLAPRADSVLSGVKMKHLFIALALCLLLCACGKPRPQTFEEQQLYMAKQQCEQEATDFNPGGPGGINPFWSSYFVMCMHNFGFTNEQLNTLWY